MRQRACCKLISGIRLSGRALIGCVYLRVLQHDGSRGGTGVAVISSEPSAYRQQQEQLCRPRRHHYFAGSAQYVRLSHRANCVFLFSVFAVARLPPSNARSSERATCPKGRGKKKRKSKVTRERRALMIHSLQPSRTLDCHVRGAPSPNQQLVGRLCLFVVVLIS